VSAAGIGIDIAAGIGIDIAAGIGIGIGRRDDPDRYRRGPVTGLACARRRTDIL
jgi:hypothetical protein